MVEEKKKKNKGIIVVITLLILLVLGFGGYFVYDMFLKTEEPVKVEEPKEEVLEEPDFYDVSELVRNNYIEKIDTTETDYIKISDGKIMVKSVYYDTFKEIGGVEGTPKYVSFIGLCSDCQGSGYIVLTEEGNVYYSEDDFEIQGVPNFKKANTDIVVNIYMTDLYQKNNFYAEISNGSILRVDKDGMNSSNTFESDFKYVDYVYIPNTGKGIAMMLDKDGKLFYKDNVEFRFNNVSEIIAKEVFSKRENSIAKYYILSNDNNIYITELLDANLNLYNEKEISNYELVTKNVGEKIFDLKINYSDGSVNTISDVMATSTIYERANK